MSESNVLQEAQDTLGGCNPLNSYDLGFTVASACQYDQRFSYTLYVPKHFTRKRATKFRLLVAVHATDRYCQPLINAFRDFADSHNVIVLAPLFPARIIDPNDVDNYKYIFYKDIRFDLVLLNMIKEVSQRYGAEWPQFMLFGFSGGAHFAHRFLLLYPQFLSAASIAAPGSVTQLDERQNWWVGTANVEKLFGKSVDVEALRRVHIHLAVGENDTSTTGIVHSPDSAHWMAGANGAGTDRVQRLKSLWNSFKAKGVDAELATLPNVGHEQGPLADAAIAYFERALSVPLSNGRSTL